MRSGGVVQETYDLPVAQRASEASSNDDELQNRHETTVVDRGVASATGEAEYVVVEFRGELSEDLAELTMAHVVGELAIAWYRFELLVDLALQFVDATPAFAVQLAKGLVGDSGRLHVTSFEC